MPETDYDVIIVGGRCAGASLALNLAPQNLKVLVIDRATFPSLPNVPSSPLIHPGTMRLLDELGMAEADYTHPGGKAEQYIMNIVNAYSVTMPTSLVQMDRSYVYGIDRCRFDNALWTHLQQRYPQVTTRENFAATDVLKDAAGQVIGIVGQTHGGQDEHLTARLVVGADGRYSFAARKFNAKTIEERNDYTTAVYHTEWENVEDAAGQSGGAASVYNTLQGFAVLFIPIAERRYIVSTYLRTQDVNLKGTTAQQYYLDDLKRIPAVWQRLEQAHQSDQVVGMRRIENGYREAFGQGWALVGDALHYKDPVDGQGIYDALIEAKLLAASIAKWHSGTLSWAEAGALYEQRVKEETHPVFLSTTARIQREMYTSPPKLIVNTLMRWLLTDPQYQTAFLRYLCRVTAPSEVPTLPGPRVIWRGLTQDLKNWLGRRGQKTSSKPLAPGN